MPSCFSCLQLFVTPWTVARQVPLSMGFSGLTCGHVKSLQACPTLCDPMDCSPPGSSVHGISQARLEEWVAISFSTVDSSFVLNVIDYNLSYNPSVILMFKLSLDWEDPLEEGMVTHSSILAWRIPWTEELGGLQSKGLQRVRPD